MNILDKMEGNWEPLYTQYRNVEGDQVLCLMNKETKEFVYFDVKQSRVLTKKEARAFRVDRTGLHLPYQEQPKRSNMTEISDEEFSIPWL
jgi:hypothetical protein